MMRSKIVTLGTSLLAVSLLLFAFFYIVQTPATAASNIIRVDADASGASADGASWATAYPNLQDGLVAATNGDEVWVAAGVYTPGNTISDTFILNAGVSLYGGFAATEILRSERDFDANLTVLSGDIDGDDMTIAGVVLTTTNQVGDNSYHVVSAVGVTNTAVLDGFTITAGQADGGSPNNRGGGMHNDSSHPTVSNVIFSGNSAGNGGGMSNLGSDPIMSNATFSGNSAHTSGGGMYNFGNDPTVSNVIFSGNSATSGGGVYNVISNPTIINATFSGNSATHGGGMFNRLGSNPTIVNTIFWGNSVAGITNTVMASLENDSSTVNISHSLVQNSGGSGSWDSAAGTDGGNNIDSDPLFVSPVVPSTAPTTTGDLSLQLASPAIDVGNTVSYTAVTTATTDLAGNPRIFNTIIDMGAYEVNEYRLTVVVAGSGSGTVTNTDGTVNCGATCEAGFTSGTAVTLTATADSHSTFNGWSGAVTSTDSTIVVTIDQAKTMTATFTKDSYTLIVALIGNGSGTVTNTDGTVNCGATCEAGFTSGTAVTLTATADSGSSFSGWSGAITSTDSTIVVTMDQAKTMTATFTKSDYAVYLPLVARAGSPDLIVTALTVSGGDDVTVVIQNIGSAAVTSEFWVDLYVGLNDSSTPPSAVDHIWQNTSPYGVAWGITSDALPLAPGASLTLTTSDNSYDASRSNLPDTIPSGTALYAQVDSANVASADGGVRETHEITNGTYNNLFGPVIR